MFMQAYDLSKDHKPDLEVEKQRILSAGGFVQCGRVNGSLNLSRAIGDIYLLNLYICNMNYWYPFVGDLE